MFAHNHMSLGTTIGERKGPRLKRACLLYRK
jgi:hypothetical protein